MQEPLAAPSPTVVQALLDVLAPDSRLQRIDSLPGGFTNASHLVEVQNAAGTRFRIVIRRYVVFGNYDRGEKARREYRALELLQAHGIPVPPPLYLDDQGAVFGSPGIVTQLLPGKQFVDPSDPVEWAQALATMLARIHALPVRGLTPPVLLDGNSDALWFARSATVPKVLAEHEDGPRVWRAVRELLPHLRPAVPVFTHLDYWPGNILWHEGRISGIVDWEEASYGDPGVDVAYARMHLLLLGMDDAAKAFLETYEALTGCLVENLALWDLAAATRPMPDPARLRRSLGTFGVVQCTAGEMQQAFKRFIDDALRRAAV